MRAFWRRYNIRNLWQHYKMRNFLRYHRMRGFKWKDIIRFFVAYFILIISYFDSKRDDIERRIQKKRDKRRLKK